jgi:hypothetical protein
MLPVLYGTDFVTDYLILEMLVVGQEPCSLDPLSQNAPLLSPSLNYRRGGIGVSSKPSDTIRSTGLLTYHYAESFFYPE